MSTVQVSRTTSTVEVSATRPRVEVGTPSIVAHNDLSGRDAADAHPIGGIAGLLPLPTADGSRYVVSHPGGANPPEWSNQAAWRDQANGFTQAQRFAAGTLTAPSVGIGSATYGFCLDGTAVVMTLAGIPRVRFAGTLNSQDNYGNYTTLAIRRANGTVEAPTKILSGDQLGLFMFRGAYDNAGVGTFDSGGGPQIRAFASEDYNSVSSRGSYLALYAIPNGSGSNVECLRVDGLNVTAAKPILAASGTVSAPGLSFSSNPTYGMYRIGSTAIGISAGGVNAITIDNAQRCTFAAGSAAAPCICLGSDHGLYRINSTAWGASVAGVSTLQLTTGQVLFFDGTAAAPGLASITTPTTGFYRASSDTIGVSSLGVQRYQLAADRLLLNANAAVIGAGGLTSGGPGMHVYSADGSGSGFLCTAFAAAPTNYFRRANGTGAAPTAVTAGQYIGGLFCQAFDGSAYFENVRIAMLTNELQSGSAAGSRMSFQCVVNGTRTLTEAMSIYGNSINANVPLVLADAANISAGTTSGTKIGTATAQKLGFWNATPVIQPAAAGQAAAAAQAQSTLTDSTGGTASTTLAAITAGATYAQADMTAVKNAIASLAARLAQVKTDVANVKTLEDAIRTALVNTGLIKGAA